MFPVGPDGNTRVWGTLKELLAASIIQDDGDDLILVIPGHSETVTSAGAIDTGTAAAGLTIVGLGEGSSRPTFNFTTAAGADINIGSDSVTWENCIFDLTGVDALTGPLDVNDTDFKLKNCEFVTADADGQAIVAIVTDANASGLVVEGCYFRGNSAVSGNVSAIRIVGGTRHLIKDSYFDGLYKITAGGIQVTTTAAGVRIENCVINNRTASSTAALDFLRDSTATVVGCVLGILSGTAPIHISEGSVFYGAGSITAGRNYYRNATTPVAGTLL